MDVHKFNREREEKSERRLQKNPKYYARQASKIAKSAKNKGKMRFCTSKFFEFFLALVSSGCYESAEFRHIQL